WRALVAALRGLPLLAGALLISSCSTSPCDDAELLRTPAFYLELPDSATDAGCTVVGFLTSESGEQSQMRCVSVGKEVCACQGGGLPGDYELIIVDVQTSQQLDRAAVSIESAAAPRCRESFVKEAFTGAYRGAEGGVGAGGAGRAGGAGN